MDGVASVLILRILDKLFCVDVFRERHGEGEEQSGAF